MENMNQLYPYIVNTVVDVLKLVIVAAFSLVIIPWLRKSAIPWLKEKQLYGIVQKFVRAAEKMGEAGIISKEDKLNYVVGLLERHGVTITPEVRALIESAVGALDDEFAKNASLIVDEFDDESGKMHAALELEHDQADGNREPVTPDSSILETIQAGAEALARLEIAE